MDLKSILLDIENSKCRQAVWEAARSFIAAVEEDDRAIAWLARRGLSWSGEAPARLPDSKEDDGQWLRIRRQGGGYERTWPIRAMGQRLICNTPRPNGGFRIDSVGESQVMEEDRPRFCELLRQFCGREVGA